MNKLLIVLLAICLVSVHAFVKRDAPATEKNNLEEFSKNFGEQIKQTFDPEVMKKRINDIIDKTHAAFHPDANKPK